MKLNGLVFKPGAVIVHDVGSEDSDMQVAIITNIYLVNSNITIFKTNLHKIGNYHSHYRAFTLVSTHTEAFFDYNAIPLYIPIHARKCRVLPNDIAVIMPFYIV